MQVILTPIDIIRMLGFLGYGIVWIVGISFAAIMGVKAGDAVTDYLYQLYYFFKYKNKPIPTLPAPSPLLENWLFLVILLLGMLLLAGFFFRRKTPRK